MPVAMTPASKRAREKSMVRRPSPMMIGVIGGLALGCGVATNVEASIGELLFEVGSVGPEAFDSFGFGLEDVEGGDTCGCDRGWVRGGEEEWSGRGGRGSR